MRLGPPRLLARTRPSRAATARQRAQAHATLRSGGEPPGAATCAAMPQCGEIPAGCCCHGRCSCASAAELPPPLPALLLAPLLAAGPGACCVGCAARAATATRSRSMAAPGPGAAPAASDTAPCGAHAASALAAPPRGAGAPPPATGSSWVPPRSCAADWPVCKEQGRGRAAPASSRLKT